MRTRFVSIVSVGALLLTGSIAVVASAADQVDPPEPGATVVEAEGDVQVVRDRLRLHDPLDSPDRDRQRDTTHRSEDVPTTADQDREQERDRDQSCDPACDQARDRDRDGVTSSADRMRDRDRAQDGDGCREQEQTRQEEQTRAQQQVQEPQQTPEQELTREQARTQEQVQGSAGAPSELGAGERHQARNVD